jgi:hypothetical protein
VSAATIALMIVAGGLLAMAIDALTLRRRP